MKYQTRVFQVTRRLRDGDADWLKNSGLLVEVEPSSRNRIAYADGRVEYFASGPAIIRITTKSQSEENWVRLYWSPDLFEEPVYDMGQLFDFTNGENT
jgi:hypothetical protein